MKGVFDIDTILLAFIAGALLLHVANIYVPEAKDARDFGYWFAAAVGILIPIVIAGAIVLSIVYGLNYILTQFFHV